MFNVDGKMRKHVSCPDVHKQKTFDSVPEKLLYIVRGNGSALCNDKKNSAEHEKSEKAVFAV